MTTLPDVTHVCALPVPSYEDLRTLSQCRGPCLSIYLPAHRQGAGTKPSHEVLDEIFRKIRSNLIADRWKERDVDTLLEPFLMFRDSPALRESHKEGLALFRVPGDVFAFSVAGGVGPGWTVQPRCCVLPILAFLSERPRYLILVLARNNVRLLRVQPGGVEPLSLPDRVPRTIASVHEPDAPAHEAANHSGPRSQGTVSVRFGTGSDAERLYRHMHTFYAAIDQGLDSMFRLESLPLVVAGTDPEIAAFQSATLYPNLVTHPIRMSGDGGLPDGELAARAGNLVREWSGKAERKAVADCIAASPDKLLHIPEEVCKAAFQGRVRDLFLRLPAASMHSDFAKIEENIYNTAVVETFRHRGHVWALPPERMFSERSITALLRYSA